jgi:DNA repair exonuclease SbcCD ATPase subunit
VIQFALLFGLGFLSATLLAMILAPAIHRRVVRYTENRLKATMPISPAEVRAQRDMARAVYAAENARTKQELLQERDRAVDLQLRHDKLSEETATLHASQHELQMQVSDMSIEAADLRARLRREEGFIQQLKESLQLVENTLIAKDEEIETLKRRIARSAGDLDNAQIDLSTRETELENLRFRAANLREERDTLRTDVKLLTARAKDAETRLQEEERRTLRLEDKISREIAEKVDLQTTVERRVQEIERLRQTRKEKPADDVAVSPPAVDGAPALLAAPAVALSGSADANAATIGLDSFADDIRNRSAALVAQLPKSKSKKAQDAMRRELAAIAADMVALTAAREGETSPIPALIAADDEERPATARESLAARARRSLLALSPANREH